MSSVQSIRLHRMALRLADTEDPVANRTRWDPLRPGGANFRTHDVIGTPAGLVVRRSAGMKAFAAAFLIPGAALLFLAAPAMLLRGSWLGIPVVLACGGVFTAAGYFLLTRDDGMTFDRHARRYYRGQAPRATGPATVQGRFDDVHALQLLTERVHSAGSSPSRITSYELNLVLADGGRVNVLDHGRQDAVLEAAKRLAALLDVPVWQAEYGYDRGHAA